MLGFCLSTYEPSDFMDPSYVNMDVLVDQVKYTIRISRKTQVDGVETEKESDCPGFSPIYTTSPFGTCTHILSNPRSDIMIGDKRLTVFKDQLCRPNPRFDEYNVLTHIHGREGMPGVVEAVYHTLIDMPECFDVARNKHRMGLRQSGSPITGVPTLKGMLEIEFDVLEGDFNVDLHMFYHSHICSATVSTHRSRYQQRKCSLYRRADSTTSGRWMWFAKYWAKGSPSLLRQVSRRGEVRNKLTVGVGVADIR